MEQEDNKKEFGSLLEDFLNKKIERRDFMKGLVALGLAGGLLNSWINTAEASSTPAVRSGAQTAPRRAVESWDDEYDVIIAGTGGTGLGAAILAYDNGVDNILVLERNPEPGGSTRRCGGMLAGAGFRMQRELGIRDSPEEFYKYLVAVGMGFTNPDQQRAYAYESGKAIDWLIDELGAEPVGGGRGVYPMLGQLHRSATLQGYELFGMRAVPREIQFKPAAPGWWGGTAGGTGIWEPLNRAVRARRIKVMLGTPVREVIRDEDYGAIGVKAGRGGRILNLRARKGVVLGCGGYMNSKEIMKNYVPPNYEDVVAGLIPKRYLFVGKLLPGHVAPHPAHDTGDGILAGMSAGAALSHIWAISNFLQNSGGLKVDGNYQVLDVFGEPIPRLYAGGRNVGGDYGIIYPTCGMQCCTGICAGRIAGRNLAKEEDWHS